MKPTRLQQIAYAYFAPYNRTLDDGEIDYVMEFIRVLLIKQGKWKPGCRLQ
jgi:hypothetical protein